MALARAERRGVASAVLTDADDVAVAAAVEEVPVDGLGEVRTGDEPPKRVGTGSSC